MAALNKIKSIQAFSMLESIVALALILLLFFISIYFFVSVKESGFSMQRMNAAAALEDYIQISFGQKNFSVKKEMINSWTVSREAQPDIKDTALLQVRFTVYKKDSLGTPFITRSFLVPVPVLSEPLVNEQP